MSEETGATGADDGLVTGANHGRGIDDADAASPEEFASSESDLALSNQVAEREQDDE